MTNDFVTAGVNLQFNYAAGEAASRFLIALRDEKKIYGTRCPECRRVLVPARSFCPRCFVETREWVEVGPGGTLVAFAASPPTPFALSPLSRSAEQERGEGVGGSEVRCLALIRLDGADTALVHRVKVNRATLRVGLRVMAVFAENRSGSILDIVHFRHLKI